MTLVSSKAKASRAKRKPSVVLADPLVPYCVWKLRRSTLDGLRVEAEDRGATVAGLVRKVLGDWVAVRQRSGKAKG